ncbi:MAG TPA: hypothetical protein VHF44_01925 [Nitrososphaeraceae archaeon]|nr:hypothetical protein [Nitrososphaeraceae archaeon]
MAPKTEEGNVKGFSCYHGGNYNTFKENQKKEFIQKGKNLLEVTESSTHPEAYICMNETAADSFEMLATTINYRNLGFK